ncbi:hypothetical protein [Luteolibacter marinus]|uniref:hypothetical protein n=1 Tax=Luteolibacter marinus TaxID=2776705 RepID=UPI001D01E119|nr:hypothetical protein [Luteolibacter marinus]
MALALSLVVLLSSPSLAEQPETPGRAKAVEALRALETETGLGADELLPAITLCSRLVQSLGSKTEDGTLSGKEIPDARKSISRRFEQISRDFDGRAALGVMALGLLNSGRDEELKDFLRGEVATRYELQPDDPDPSAVSFKKAAEHVAKSDPILKALLEGQGKPTAPEKQEKAR